MPSTENYNNNITLISTETQDYSFCNDNLNNFITIDSSNNYIGFNTLNPTTSIDISGSNIKSTNLITNSIIYDYSNNTSYFIIDKINTIIDKINDLSDVVNITPLNSYNVFIKIESLGNNGNHIEIYDISLVINGNQLLDYPSLNGIPWTGEKEVNLKFLVMLVVLLG